ncbi:MAG TPA: ATP-dependent sacrificial sulfur transferase LarE, partial [Nitrososphaerales archaeon]|nr:ATP-dependent sacrificial sulfur transferase LarE [Nitrososphaerales archaeon]
AAKKALDGNAIAVTADYKTLSDEELESARKIAIEIGIKHQVIEYSELDNRDFVKNDEHRCFHCRNELAEHLLEVAEKEKARLIVDGTNADDLDDFRPGIQALKQHGVKSPLVELSITKKEVRQIASMLSLSIFDRPSNACLASRIPHGTEVTADKLRRIEQAEIIVKKLFHVKQVRVRDHDEIARIEVGRDERSLLFDQVKLDELDSELKKLGFRFVAIEASGYKSGNLNVV